MGIIAIRTVIIYAAVILAVRTMGKRQVGQLRPHELVITILISSVATIPLQDINIPLANCILPIVLFVCLELIFGFLSVKSIKLRDIVQGKPVCLISDGKLDVNMLTKMRITTDDLVDLVRQAGCFDLSEVDCAVMETDGTVSVKLKSGNAPVTPELLSISADDSGLAVPIVIDKKYMGEYFKGKKIKKSELDLLLEAENLDINNIMLLSIDGEGSVTIIDKDGKIK